VTSRTRRSSILVVAADLFRHYGAQKTTIGDIAKAAKIAVGSVYLEFGSKEDILHELSRDVHTRILEEMTQIAEKHADDAGESLAAALQARTEAYLECREEGPHGCDLTNCAREAVLQAKQKFYEKETALLAGIIERGVKQRVFAKVSALEAAQTCLRAMASLSPPMLWNEDPRAARTATKALADLLVRGLSTTTK
jgi:AcrR family transcriptional regulator